MKKFFIGLILGFASAGATLAVAQVTSSVDTNGTLVGYIVQQNGVEICRNPDVFVQFRGPESYIVCK